jgi:hypothetical protein
VTSGVEWDRADLVPKICARLAKGEPLAVICRDIGISRRVVYQWRDADPAIADLMQDARDDGYDAIASECLDIADDNTQDWKVVKRGRDEQLEIDKEAVLRSKLRVETRLKLLAKWDPKRYGERMQLDHRSPDGTMSPKPVMSKEELRDAVRDVVEKF